MCIVLHIPLDILLEEGVLLMQILMRCLSPDYIVLIVLLDDWLPRYIEAHPTVLRLHRDVVEVRLALLARPREEVLSPGRPYVAINFQGLVGNDLYIVNLGVRSAALDYAANDRDDNQQAHKAGHRAAHDKVSKSVLADNELLHFVVLVTDGCIPYLEVNIEETIVAGPHENHSTVTD